MNVMSRSRKVTWFIAFVFIWGITGNIMDLGDCIDNRDKKGSTICNAFDKQSSKKQYKCLNPSFGQQNVQIFFLSN